MLTLDLIATLGGLIVPPAYDFIKKKFIKPEEDTPERTVASLASTNPEVIAPYTEAQAKLFQAKVDWFNRDVIGNISQWVSNLRASIRPTTVIGCMFLIALDGTSNLQLDPGAKLFCYSSVSSWFGSRLIKN